MSAGVEIVRRRVEDTGDVGSNDGKTGTNTRLVERREQFLNSKVIDIEGAIPIDLFQQSRLLINGVSIGIKLHPARDAFTLITDSLLPNYRLSIKNCGRSLQIMYSEVE
ncbi:hypothetical protein ACF0H5_006626 [Mactra antiquata]